jgi:hypothetical protein
MAYHGERDGGGNARVRNLGTSQVSGYMGVHCNEQNVTRLLQGERENDGWFQVGEAT